jgi:hypothetical protein
LVAAVVRREQEGILGRDEISQGFEVAPDNSRNAETLAVFAGFHPVAEEVMQEFRRSLRQCMLDCA